MAVLFINHPAKDDAAATALAAHFRPEIARPCLVDPAEVADQEPRRAVADRLSARGVDRRLPGALAALLGKGRAETYRRPWSRGSPRRLIDRTMELKPTTGGRQGLELLIS
jgi:hypothetical protein